MHNKAGCYSMNAKKKLKATSTVLNEETCIIISYLIKCSKYQKLILKRIVRPILLTILSLNQIMFTNSYLHYIFSSAQITHKPPVGAVDNLAYFSVKTLRWAGQWATRGCGWQPGLLLRQNSQVSWPMSHAVFEGRCGGSLVAHQISDAAVSGSNPASPTIILMLRRIIV